MSLIRSWVESANSPTHPFPLNNLPYGVFSTADTKKRCGVAIGDYILDVQALQANGFIVFGSVFNDPSWNAFMEQGRDHWRQLRERLTALLAEGADEQEQLAAFLTPIEDAKLHLPIVVTEFTDFYASKYHAMNVGTMFRGPENALPPNWLHIPIGYNGRASTVVVSGTKIVRPCGQTKALDADMPSFGPCNRLDIELEMGAIVGRPSEMGTSVSVDQADEMIFGYVLLNDWSARDIQAWEYQPLGPFQAKAFATSISPWIVTTDALEQFRATTPERERDLLPYLRESKPMLFDIDLEVGLAPEGMAETVIARTNYNQMYYSAAQQLAHHASSGCAMRVGDLLGSGTISGPGKSERGSLLELSWGGKEPIKLKDGGTRSFIEDGDTLTLRGAAHGDGFQVGFGECVGVIIPVKE
ncbi:fumarylacetoacetase [Algirhabdus cladophorae]|uniref:fumarylacetoacetase n=1 Tax=Algirhabdus cladophorae TaxID=3377108 RepID=UPI003B84A4B9